MDDGGNLLWLTDPDAPAGMQPLAEQLGAPPLLLTARMMRAESLRASGDPAAGIARLREAAAVKRQDGGDVVDRGIADGDGARRADWVVGWHGKKRTQKPEARNQKKSGRPISRNSRPARG